MLRIKNKRALVITAGVVVAGAVIATAAIAAVGDEPNVYTGCLSKDGTLSKVAVGEAPFAPCEGKKKGETQIQWKDGIDGLPGKDGMDGEDGVPGKDGRDGVARVRVETRFGIWEKNNYPAVGVDTKACRSNEQVIGGGAQVTGVDSNLYAINSSHPAGSRTAQRWVVQFSRIDQPRYTHVNGQPRIETYKGTPDPIPARPEFGRPAKPNPKRSAVTEVEAGIKFQVWAYCQLVR